MENINTKEPLRALVQVFRIAMGLLFLLCSLRYTETWNGLSQVTITRFLPLVGARNPGESNIMLAARRVRRGFNIAMCRRLNLKGTAL